MISTLHNRSLNTPRARAAIAILIVAVLALVLLGIAQRVYASGVWYVKTVGNDSNDCASPATACATINGALAKGGFVAGDTIQVAGGTYTGTGTEVVLIDKNVLISGGWDAGFASQTGNTILDGQNTRRVVTVASAVTATIDHFTIQNGRETRDMNSGGGGAGINNAGNLTVNNSIIQDNLSIYPSSQGAGIYNSSNATISVNETLIQDNESDTWGGGIYNLGTATLTKSSIKGNIAGKVGSGGGGGGGVVNDNGTMTINESTISGNRLSGAFSGGAGIDATGTFSGGVLTLNNSTVNGNTGGTYGIGIHAFVGTVNLNNSTISGNQNYGIYYEAATFNLRNTILANATLFDCYQPIGYAGTANSLGYNLVENNSSCTLGGTDLTGSDPFLTPLGNNGGPTQTMALFGGSPAIDNIPPANCFLATDQRGVTRPQSTNCDIGAYEATGVESTVTPTPTFTPTATFTITPSPTITLTPSPTMTPNSFPVVSEDFEGRFPKSGWTVLNGWGKSGCQHVSGASSAWAVQKQNGNNCKKVYPNKGYNWMIYGPFSPKDAKKATLAYSMWLNSEYGHDGLFVGISVDGHKYYGKVYTGKTLGMAEVQTELDAENPIQPQALFANVSPAERAETTHIAWGLRKFNLNQVPTLGKVSGKPKVWFAFVWISDGQNGVKGGVFIDDVLLTKAKK